MHFKSLELIGFKSFAEKTRLNFEPGVTAIVGPNGCGKSNIADGIRWVLGEQSTKSLRASKMEDVIFNGTDTKEPINFAEVSLILSNEKRLLPIDYDEVTISRRVFRSGENEYLLNKTPVRLKDISELLMGTGIGTESYSIIEQGKMDLILSSRPEDRRYVFEEASGITKYKSKKKEALRKLEQTEANLLRINDIIQEVKRQISSIERQARKAECYKVDFDKLKDIEVKLSHLEFKDLKTEEKTHMVEGADLREREKDMDSEIKSISSKISDYRQSLDELNQKISDLKTELASMSNSFDMNLHKIDIDKERVREARLAQEALNKEMASINEKLNATEALVKDLKADLDKLASLKTAKQKSAEEKEFLLNNILKEIEEREERLKISKVNTVDYLARETKIKNELIRLGADVQNRRARQRRLDIESQTVQKDLDGANKSLEAILKEFADIETRLLSIRSDLESKRDKDQALSLELRSAEEGISKEENKRSAVKSKIEFLEDLIKKYEGFKTGVKNLLHRRAEDANSPGGIFAVLADIIKVDKDYEEAVSVFLGDDAQLVITEKESDIASAIDYLRENRLGKATFLSLETSNKIRAASPRKEIDSLVPLKNFVKSDSRYKIVIDHIFDNAYLADSLEDKVKDYALSNSITIVTRSGLMFRDGAHSGGSASESDESLLVGRKDRLDALNAELKHIEEETALLKFKREGMLDSVNLLKGEIKSIEDALRSEEINLSNIKAKRDSHEEGVKKLKEELSVAGLELEEVGQAIDDLTKKGETLNRELNDIENEKSGLQLFIDESQVLITENRSRREKLTIEITTLKTEAQSLDKEGEGLKNNLEKEEAAYFELMETLNAKNGFMKESIGKALSLEDEISRLKLENEKISEELKLAEDRSGGIEKTRSDVIDKLSIDEIQLKERDGGIERLRNQIRDLDVKMAEITYKKTNLKDRIHQAYKVDLESLHMELEDGIDRGALKTQVLELKDRLDKLGPVNLVAIDEHKELEERHSFLVHQQEDLVNAKESLLKAIQKINKTTKELFIDTFQKIQVEFKNFFRLLFGGGQAELVLIDEQDILESGIEIIVRPPGKKLQNIMLLSGGEKALTATALLFSIFKVKPSPFCVLDEIDAPLDESNIVRFSNVLKDLLKMSQFIIITHNKRTIELADVMYGITMQERGISKIVSVKFLDEKKKEGEKVIAPA